MNVEKMTNKLLKRGIPRRYANRYAILLIKDGKSRITPLDVWNIREDIKLESRIRREYPGLAVHFDDRTRTWKLRCDSR